MIYDYCPECHSEQRFQWITTRETQCCQCGFKELNDKSFIGRKLEWQEFEKTLDILEVKLRELCDCSNFLYKSQQAYVGRQLEEQAQDIRKVLVNYGRLPQSAL